MLCLKRMFLFPALKNTTLSPSLEGWLIDANSVETIGTEQVDIFALSAPFRGVDLWTAIKRCCYLNAVKLCMSFFVFPSNTGTRTKRGVFSASEVSPG